MELKGRQEGRQEGRLNLILRQLKLKFGGKIEDHKAQLEKASIEQLDQIGERILTCDSVEVVIK